VFSCGGENLRKLSQQQGSGLVSSIIRALNSIVSSEVSQIQYYLLLLIFALWAVFIGGS
jgi:hypothetical protein